uniref:RING-type E3 ubiquitin transferase n=1 Tax=Pseudictyota dubia TaxID=2749911 RepID=A0A6U2FVB9_9STRA
MHDLDPSFAVDEEEDENNSSSEADRVPTVAANAHYRRKKSKPAHDSLAMQLNGTIISPNCAFRSEVNVTAVRTDWEHTTGKAINYSFYMMLTCLTQIVVLLRQMLHTQSPSAAVRVSLLCVGWQTVLDAVLCVGHIFLCLVMQPLFTAFASVAFFKLLIFCVIEMKYMAIVVQARHNASNNAGNDTSAEELRRKVALLHLRFYAALMFATAGFWAFGQKHRILYVLFLYSFWVPQIVCNIITEAKKPLHHYFVYGMSVTRLVAPMYMFAVPNNFMKEVNPDFPTDLLMCELLVLWVGVQAAVLIAQGKYGARFMIPAIFLPPKYDYSRPIPPSMKPPPPPPSETPKPPRNISDDEADGAGAVVVKQRGPRIRKGSGKGKSSGGPRRKNAARVGSEESKGTTMTVSEGTRPPPDAPTLDCVICYNDIDISDRMGYMLAPCDHIFHRTCLEQWMDVKMECPICRKELPAL